MRLPVTGGLGVNGAWVTLRLVERGLSPLVVERGADTSLLGQRTAREVEHVRADVTDGDAMLAPLRRHRPRRIIHISTQMPDARNEP